MVKWGPMAEHIYLSPRARATILWIIAIVGLVFLWEVRDILSPFIWAIITVYVLNPLLQSIAMRTGLPRRLCAIISYILLLGLLVWGFSVLIPALSGNVAQLVKDLPGHIREAGKLLGQSQIDVLGVTINLAGTDAEINREIGQLFTELGRNIVPNALPRVFETVIKLLLYLIATFFLLLEADKIGPSVERFTPSAVKNELGPWMARINSVLGAYIRGQLFLVALMSVVSFIALTILGVRFAPLLAIFTGLVETMPFVGPYIAGAVAVFVALTQGSAPFGWSPTVLAIAVALTYTVLRQVEDNFVMPLVVGRLVHLHPLAVIFSVLAGATLGGILGLLLAVPVAATIKIVATYLYRKFNERPPRHLVLVEADNEWATIVERVHEAVLLSQAEGALRPRLLLSIPTPPAFLLDPAQFRLLPVLLAESNADTAIFTENEELIRLVEAANIPVQDTLDLGATSLQPPDMEEEHRPARRSRTSNAEDAPGTVTK
jgi:predicted PurR-regulated permease PerM